MKGHFKILKSFKIVLIIALAAVMSAIVLNSDAQARRATENLDRYNCWSVEASSSSENGDAAFAADNDFTTRWDSNHDEKESWLMFDFGLAREINMIVIAWETAVAQRYKIQVSQDGKRWTTAYANNQGEPGFHIVKFATHLRARYIRLYCMNKVDDDWGYSVYEFAVFGEK